MLGPRMRRSTLLVALILGSLVGVLISIIFVLFAEPSVLQAQKGSLLARHSILAAICLVASLAYLGATSTESRGSGRAMVMGAAGLSGFWFALIGSAWLVHSF